MMTLDRAFSQGTVITKFTSSGGTLATRGLCFRVAAKWAACTMSGGEYRYDSVNVVKTVGKHRDYRTSSLKTEADMSKDFTQDKTLKDYFEADILEAASYINKWGVKFTGRDGSDGKVVYNGVSTGSPIQQKVEDYLSPHVDVAGLTFVYGFFGRINPSGRVVPAGHATAFSNGRFFDPNYGVYSFAPADGKAVGTEIRHFLSTTYTTWTPVHHVVFAMAKAP